MSTHVGEGVSVWVGTCRTTLPVLHEPMRPVSLQPLHDVAVLSCCHRGWLPSFSLTLSGASLAAHAPG